MINTCSITWCSVKWNLREMEFGYNMGVIFGYKASALYPHFFCNNNTRLHERRYRGEVLKFNWPRFKVELMNDYLERLIKIYRPSLPSMYYIPLHTYAVQCTNYQRTWIVHARLVQNSDSNCPTGRPVWHLNSLVIASGDCNADGSTYYTSGQLANSYRTVQWREFSGTLTTT